MANTQSIRVTLIGPIAKDDEPARGGYQACNRRTILALRSMGIEVQALAYPHPTTKGLSKLSNYLFGFLGLLLRILLLKHRIVHITGLYKHFIYIEALVALLVKAKQSILIYDIRAGSMRHYYSTKSVWYRFVFRQVLRISDRVMIEGMEYSSFVQEITGTSPYHLPNHVPISEESLDTSIRDRAHISDVRIVYAGRLTQAKGIEIVLDAAARLRQSGSATRVLIAGEGDTEYVSKLKTRYSDTLNEWLGSLSSDQIVDLFRSGHFFLFPTSHPGEGHSNALTEAMASGCIPIVSKNGFNQSVIGDCGYALEMGATARDYSAVVETVLGSGQWSSLSRNCADRARRCFDTTVVVSNLVREYQYLVRSAR